MGQRLTIWSCSSSVLTLVVLRKWEKEFGPYFLAFNLFTCIPLFVFLYDFWLNDTVSIIAWTSEVMALSGGWMALLFAHSKKAVFRTAIIVAAFTLSFLVVYHYKYIHYFNNFGTFRYVRNIPVNPSLYTLSDEDGALMHFEKDKIYIIDFWYTDCGVCYQEFPQFDERAKRNTNPDIKYVSINWPYKTDSENLAFEVLKRYNYSFTQWIGSSNIDTAFGLTFYPTTIAFRNDTILYKGDLERLDDFLNTLENAAKK